MPVFLWWRYKIDTTFLFNLKNSESFGTFASWVFYDKFVIEKLLEFFRNSGI